MYGSRLATAAPRSPPPAPAITDNKEIQQRDKETRDPLTSPPPPVPDRIARGQPSPKSWPQLFCTAISAVCLGPAAAVVVSSGTFALRRALKSHERSHIPECNGQRHGSYRLAADCTRRRGARRHPAWHRLDRAVARLHRHFPPARAHRWRPPTSGSGCTSLRTTRRENQGVGSYPAGSGRPVASRSGSIANPEAPFRRAAG